MPQFAFLTQPEDYNPSVEVVSCVCWHKNRFLCLLRNKTKKEGDKWGFPAGKMQENETREGALMREFYEEMRLKLENFNFKKTFYVRYPETDFTFHLFETFFEGSNPPEVIMAEDANINYTWFTIGEFLRRKVVNGNKEIVKALYGR